ncbi:nuclear transport factor 2 family protein [Frankia sp. AgKG'84/4]|uniref:nuclear transport factor 2 family protein n=1 Tax=Frankia sp. AgKG'84/4 TaxID=573490 RepID=UPI00200CC0FF|nr:nuclear transport factor 2 family protein [Frankia sp. AgKG'84/4]MCL9795046.1 nuclear transport factor 2 family protein [Frankia sp. AgKG'84/4]
MSSGSVTRNDTGIVGIGVTPELIQAVAAAANRVYEAWAVSGTDQRAAVLAEVCSPDVDYVNPLKGASGIQELAELISEVTATYPGHLPARTSGLDTHHDVARYEWVLRDRAGQVVLGGVEIIRFTPDVRITDVISFFGAPPRISYSYRA